MGQPGRPRHPILDALLEFRVELERRQPSAEDAQTLRVESELARPLAPLRYELLRRDPVVLSAAGVQCRDLGRGGARWFLGARARLQCRHAGG